ncbi:MAG: hypothetical protein M3Y32_00135 [Pseudomonadota bacterium]|nr:hypothetical protein [Pseudomonadota bacterium]
MHAATLPLHTLAPSQPLRLPSTEQGLRYAMTYWSAAARSLFGEHRVRSAAAGRYATAFEMSDALRQRWHDLFTDHRGGVPVGCPLLYSQSVGTLLYARLFADLGINLRHLLHLKHSVTHPLGTAAYLAAGRQVLACRVKRCVRAGPARVLVLLETQLTDEQGRTVAMVEDGFMVRNVPLADVAAAEPDRVLLRELMDLRRRRTAIDSAASTARRAWLPIAPDLAQRFGRVSGDLNPIHTGGLCSRLLGTECASVQGLYLRNRVVRKLGHWGLAPERFEITFTSPAYVGQTLQLRQHGPAFEVVDGQDRLVAHGQC